MNLALYRSYVDQNVNVNVIKQSKNGEQKKKKFELTIESEKFQPRNRRYRGYHTQEVGDQDADPALV